MGFSLEFPRVRVSRPHMEMSMAQELRCGETVHTHGTRLVTGKLLGGYRFSDAENACTTKLWPLVDTNPFSSLTFLVQM